MNPIEVTDFFAPDLDKGIESVVKNLESMMGRIETAMKNVAEQAKTLEGELKSTRGSKPIDPKSTDEVQKLNDEFKRLLNTYGIYKTEISQVTSLQRDQNQIVKLQKQYAESAEGSYNKLSAEYRLLKIAMNEMGTEEEGEIKRLEIMTQRANELYSAMNEYQKSTGKYTLQVGDYSRAMNGLSLSTQQVLREMPTLANSLQQFFIAISNNVPIFVDNLKAVQKESGSWAVAMKGVVTSLFSWQTALLVVLTILPRLAKAIHDKRKAQEADNKATEKALTYAELLAKAENAVGEARINASVKLKTLYDISQDVTRSYEDRIKAAEALKKEYKDELQNVSAVAIANGEAKGVIDALTNSLVAQAQARAYLSEIEKLTLQHYDLETKKASELAKIKDAEGKQEIALSKQRIALARIERDALAGIATSVDSERQLAKAGQEVEKWTKSIEEAQGNIINFDAQMQDVENTITDLRDRIKAEDLFSEDTIGGSFKNALDKLGDYYYDWLESKAKILKNQESKELALSDIGYERQIANAKKRLEEERATGKLTEEQERYQLDIINNLYEEKLQARNAIITKWVTKLREELSKKYTEAVTEEGVQDDFVSVFDNIREAIAKSGSEMLASSNKINELLSEGAVREARKESEAFRKAAREKLDAEKDLQVELLNLRKETTGMTDAEYQIELNNILTSYDKAIAKLNKKKGGKRFSIWTMLFGTAQADPDTKQITKVLTAEQEFFFKTVEDSFKTAISYANEWMKARMDMANAEVEAAQKEVDATKTALDYEMEARANGYANNVELARKEYQEKLNLQKEALKEQERLKRQQDQIDTATQASSLITATAGLWKSMSGTGPAAPYLAAAATAAMWTAFIAAKARARQVTTYGDGMSEYLDYGGSHASGHDIDFGTTKDGTNRRVERGEIIGVINKKNVRKYGVNEVLGIINSLNNGTFEKTYGNAFSGLTLLDEGHGSDLSKVEEGLDTLVSQGQSREYYSGGKRVQIYKNVRRVITNA